MNVGQMRRILASILPMRASELDQRTRALTVLPHCPGRHAPFLVPEQVAVVLLALASRRAVHANVIAKHLWHLPPSDGDGPCLGPTIRDVIAGNTPVPRRIDLECEGRFARMMFGNKVDEFGAEPIGYRVFTIYEPVLIAGMLEARDLVAA